MRKHQIAIALSTALFSLQAFAQVAPADLEKMKVCLADGGTQETKPQALKVVDNPSAIILGGAK